MYYEYLTGDGFKDILLTELPNDTKNVDDILSEPYDFKSVARKQSVRHRC